jgi:hypothetical protein
MIDESVRATVTRLLVGAFGYLLTNSAAELEPGADSDRLRRAGHCLQVQLAYILACEANMITMKSVQHTIVYIHQNTRMIGLKLSLPKAPLTFERQMRKCFE